MGIVLESIVIKMAAIFPGLEDITIHLSNIVLFVL